MCPWGILRARWAEHIFIGKQHRQAETSRHVSLVLQSTRGTRLSPFGFCGFCPRPQRKFSEGKEEEIGSTKGEINRQMSSWITVLLVCFLRFWDRFYCVAPGWPETHKETRLDLNSQNSTCLGLLSAGIKGVQNHIRMQFLRYVTGDGLHSLS